MGNAPDLGDFGNFLRFCARSCLGSARSAAEAPDKNILNLAAVLGLDGAFSIRLSQGRKGRKAHTSSIRSYLGLKVAICLLPLGVCDDAELLFF